MRRVPLVSLAILLGAAGTAAAYPQFQMSKDQTCSGCHLSPAGGGLLNENGLNTAESISQYGQAPEFFYKKVPLPDWLAVGGDFRAAGGFIRTPDNNPAVFPMQADLYGTATFGHFSLHATVGARPPEDGNESATYVWAREHYIQWQQNAGGTDGLYVRVGHFLPVIGLRFVEHVDYNRRYGGAPLYGETYAAAVELIKPKYEVHVTGFIKDPVIDPVLHDNGVAAYAETRLNERTSLGLEAMYTDSDDDSKFRIGFTAKHYCPSQDFLIQAEGQFVQQKVDGGGAPAQLVGYLMLSKFLGKAFLLDAGIGHFDENVRIEGLDRDAVDVNLHWFTTSHFEMILQNRVDVVTYGPTGAWSLLQLHYRL